jgi:hypothetical protein
MPEVVDLGVQEEKLVRAFDVEFSGTRHGTLLLCGVDFDENTVYLVEDSKVQYVGAMAQAALKHSRRARVADIAVDDASFLDSSKALKGVRFKGHVAEYDPPKDLALTLF